MKARKWVLKINNKCADNVKEELNLNEDDRVSNNKRDKLSILKTNAMDAINNLINEYEKSETTDEQECSDEEK